MSQSLKELDNIIKDLTEPAIEDPNLNIVIKLLVVQLMYLRNIILEDTAMYTAKIHMLEDKLETLAKIKLEK